MAEEPIDITGVELSPQQFRREEVTTLGEFDRAGQLVDMNEEVEEEFEEKRPPKKQKRRQEDVLPFLSTPSPPRRDGPFGDFFRAEKWRFFR